MKNYFKIFIKCLSFVLFVSIQLMGTGQAQNVYVWDFKTKDPTIKKFAEKFTDDFETELIKLDNYTVLQRRNHNLVLVHRDMENAISNVKNLPAETVDKLKTIRAEIVVFGQLMEDVDSGVFEVTVFFQNLSNGEIPKKESIIIEKALIKSNSHRKQYMKDLITKLHAKEILDAKNEQLGFISKKMDTYMVRVKDVKIAFNDIIDIALKKEEYFKELENIINAYNEIFTDLNDNREKYLLDFQSVFGKAYGKDFEAVYKGILEDIHKKHILKLNDVRKKIWTYRESQLSKKERETIKKEIMRASENSTLGLNVAIDKVEDDMGRLFFNLKEEMKD
ncbi:hypothetical protein [Algibacter sp. 2305UL17-15]|uniref:hypothetical protein n=1 Tax=Algibacter sp. 2305UL17-15 TaxID=3231268 RepID=UPI0034582738